MTLKNYNLFCECYIRSMMGLLNTEEMAYQKKYQKPSPKYINEAQKIKSKCT